MVSAFLFFSSIVSQTGCQFLKNKQQISINTRLPGWEPRADVQNSIISDYCIVWEVSGMVMTSFMIN